jgi:sulfur-carrier protein
VTVPVRLPAALRPLADGQAVIQVDVGATSDVAAVLDRLSRSHPALERRLRDEQGQLRPHVNVFVGSDNIKDLDNFATTVADGTEVSIIPAISGG